MLLDKWVQKLTRIAQKYEPWRRKHYKKARFRKAAGRFERFCDAEEERYAAEQLKDKL